jgi:hypothetical protein
MGTIGNNLQSEDRLGHMGGLSGTLLTAQTVGLDLNANLGVSNISQRIGKADFSEVEWYLEWYTATGATITTPTANVTFHDGTTGVVNINNLGGTALPANVAASRRYMLQSTNGKFIRSVASVTLSASTGTAGNFGVTAVRNLATVAQTAPLNTPYTFDVWNLNAPEIYDNACVTNSMIPNTTSTGVVTGRVTQAVN